MTDKIECRIYYSKVNNPFDYPVCPVCGDPIDLQFHSVTVRNGAPELTCWNLDFRKSDSTQE